MLASPSTFPGHTGTTESFPLQGSHSLAGGEGWQNPPERMKSHSMYLLCLRESVQRRENPKGHLKEEHHL